MAGRPRAQQGLVRAWGPGGGEETIKGETRHWTIVGRVGPRVWVWLAAERAVLTATSLELEVSKIWKERKFIFGISSPENTARLLLYV